MWFDNYAVFVGEMRIEQDAITNWKKYYKKNLLAP